MTSIEKKMLLAIAALLFIFIGSCVALSNVLDDEFGECKGLEGVVNKVWSGDTCAEDKQ